MKLNHIHTGNSLDVLKTFPDQAVHCCVTSPPYYGLRDYGMDNQLGLEEAPEKYIENMVEVFREVKRVLRKDGTLWLNIADSYNGSGEGGGTGEKSRLSNKFKDQGKHTRETKIQWLKKKDLIGIPWMLAFALRADGWYLRQDIIWAKPNPMPESVTDRCTKSHEYIFLLSKSAKYYYDHEAIKVPMAESSFDRLNQVVELQAGSDRVPGKTNGAMKAVGTYVGGKKHKNMERDKPNGFHSTRNSNGQEWMNSDGKANKRSVWTVTTKPYSEAHFATFPPELIVDCIKAGCPEDVCIKCSKPKTSIIENEYVTHENWYGEKQNVRHSRGKAGNAYNEKVGSKIIGQTDCGCNAEFSPGIVLDPFMGAGTTGMVARKLNRNFVGVELNPKYVAIAEKRLYNELGMFI